MKHTLAFLAALTITGGQEEPIQLEAKGVDTRVIWTSELRDHPHASMTSLASDIQTIIGILPPKRGAVIFEWIPDKYGESGHFRATVFNLKKKPAISL